MGSQTKPEVASKKLRRNPLNTFRHVVGVYLTEAVIESAGGSCCRKLDCNSSPRFVRSRSYFPTTSARVPFPSRHGKTISFVRPVFCNLHPRDDPHPAKTSDRSARRSLREIVQCVLFELCCTHRSERISARAHPAFPRLRNGGRGRRTWGRERESRTASVKNNTFPSSRKYYATRPAPRQANAEELSSAAFTQCTCTCILLTCAVELLRINC